MDMDRKQSWNDLLTPAREDELQALYERVVGTSSGIPETENKPFYLRAAEKRSAKMAMSTEQLLATYSERLRNSSYPTPDCLTADEVQAHAAGNVLAPARIQHATSCAGCQNLLEAIQPSPQVVLELMEEVRLIATRVSGHTRAVAAGSSEETYRVAALRSAALFHS